MRTFTLCSLLLACSLTTSALQTEERIGRAPVAVTTSQGILVSWRSLKSDAPTQAFNVYRNGTLIASDITTKTNFVDKDGKAGDTYRIETSGSASETKAWDNIYTSIELARPKSRKDAAGKTTGRYRPDDISVGDVDGDGEYELVLKWMPDNARDSGKEGYSSPAYISCYEMDGTPLWTIDTGYGIRSGNHYTQFLVYDFDGDGKAEVIFKTAAGTKDGKGQYVSEAATDPAIKAIDNTATHVNSNGRVTAGEELLTVFNGMTGEAMHTIWYSPNRALVNFPTADGEYSSSWGDSSYNRGERYNAAVAYLDGEGHLPSAIMQRGYYTYCFLWAVDWNGTQLSTRWLHKGSKGKWEVFDANGTVTKSGTGASSYGQGVHGISIGDVNGDGYDDIVTGGATVSYDGSLLCSTGKGHADAIHLADLCPDRTGLEVMMPHEDSPYGYDVHDATTGELLVIATSSGDNGRGLACDFIPANRGSEFWSSADGNTYSCTDGSVVLAKKADTNFRIYWTADPYDQTFDGRYDSNTGKCAPRIRCFNTATNSITTFMEFAQYGNPSACNTTKATPCLQADILGDWREELIMYEYEPDWSASTCKLLIYSTPEPTEHKVTCLMQDHIYRMGIAWQNSSYNQPPHLGYSLPDRLGIDGATYQTNVKSYAPVPTAETQDGTEPLVTPSEDKAVVKGICYTAGENGEMTASTSNGYIKIRTGNNGNTLTFTVNEGFVIKGMRIEAFSNNTSKTADRSIFLTAVNIDGSESSVLKSTVTLPGGTAGQEPAITNLSGFEAKTNIVLTFDNSLITTSDVDPAGKNKQMFAKITFTYAIDTAIGQTETETPAALSSPALYNIQGQRIASPLRRGVYIMNGKKYVR
ncbi:MAG: rhamnogalacturonan lyase [Prevotella sp.]|nr:rhamnogalacturonan lyase [Prevotella sp.]